MSKNGRLRNFGRAFKVEAVRLVMEERRKVAEVARDLDIQANLLQWWKRELSEDGNGAFPGKGQQTPEQEELSRLRRELVDVKEERDILKKAFSVFSHRRE